MSCGSSTSDRDAINTNRSSARKKKIRSMILVSGLVLGLGACATAGGALIGAGIGGVAGDAKMGALVGGTTGAVIDIFGR